MDPAQPIANPASSPFRHGLKSPSAIIACLLHVVTFLWLFQLGFTIKEMQSIDASLESNSMDAYMKTYDFIIEEHGHIGLIKFFFHHHHESRLYYRYAKLLLRGDATHWIWNDGRQFENRRPWPYRDVPVEYQPGAFLVLVPPALIAEDFREYRFWLAAWLGLLYGLNLYLALHLLTAGRPTRAAIQRTLWGSLAFLLCFGCIAVTRFDHAVVTAVLLALWVFRAAVHSEGRKALLLFAAFGLVTAVGVLTKIVPGLVIPAALLALVFLKTPGPDWRSALATCFGLTAGLVFLNLGFWMLWGDGYWASFTYHMERGIQIETLYAGLILLANWWAGYEVTQVFTFSSSNLEFSHSELFRKLPLYLFSALSLWIAWRVYRSREAWKKADTDRVFPVYLLSLIFLLAFILTNKVFSPQYLLWVGPLMAVLVAVRTDLMPTGGWFLAATAMTQAIFPHLYVFLEQFKPPMILLLNLRNAILLGILILLVRKLPELWKTARGGSGIAGELPLDMDHPLDHGEAAERRDDENAGEHHERADIGNAGEPRT